MPISLAPTGDQLLLYQGTDAAPTFVAAFTYGPTGFTDATSAATTALPPGLTVGTSAVALPAEPTAIYSAATRAGLPADLRAAFNTAINWTRTTSRGTWSKAALNVSEGLVPDAQELAALQDFYNSTGGATTWYNRTGWLQGTNNAEHWATWYGVGTSGGDVIKLDLYNKGLSGSLPPAVGKLTQLQYLSLGRSVFSSPPPPNFTVPGLGGTLPKELGQLIHLRYLAVTNTLVSGAIPPELGNLAELTYFDLNNNHLTGSIPRELGQLGQLQYLNLDNYNRLVFEGNRNALTGGIPKELGQLTNLTYLALDMNPLGGPIPPELGKLTKLTFLEVDDAHLSGAVPAEIMRLPQLQTLILGGRNRDYSDPNTFTSLPDPSVIANKSGLTIALQYNQFDFGTLEPYFSAPGQLITASGSYLPQTLPQDEQTIALTTGQALSLASGIGGTQTRYQWQRENGGSWQPIPAATGPSYQIAATATADAGRYRCQATNDLVTGLTLTSRPYLVRLTGRALPPSDPADDLDRNWSFSRTFDLDGTITGESKQFADAMGRPTQSQSKNLAEGHVFATQSLNSTGGVAVLSTLPAPINNQEFKYKAGFVTATTVPAGGGAPTSREYAPVNFERPTNGSSPDPLDEATPGTLGYYYSPNNAWEPATAATHNPFSLSEATPGPLGGMRRAAGPGDAFALGSGREARGRDFPLLNELDHYAKMRALFVPGSATPSMRALGVKVVGVSPNGVESVTFSNREGQAVAACLTGDQYPASTLTGYVYAESVYPSTAPVYQDLHIPVSAQPTTVTITDIGTIGGGPSTFVVIELLSNPLVETAYTGAQTLSLTPGFYRVQATTGLVGFSYPVHYGNFSYVFYDDAGRAVASIAPKGMDELLRNGLDNAPLVAPPVGPDGAVGYWPLGAGAGTTAADGSGNGFTGTLRPTGPQWSTNAPPSGRGSIAFNGQFDYVQVGDPPALRMSTTMSLEAWIYPAGGGSGIIVNKENEYEIARYPDGSIQWAFQNANPGWNWINTGIIAPLNTWSRIGLTYDNGVVQAYLNGNPVGAAYAGSGTIVYQGSDFWIGGRSGYTQFFEGNIAEVRLWNTIYPFTSGGSGTVGAAGAVGYWPLGAGAGATAADGSGNGFTGTLRPTGPQWSTNAPPGGRGSIAFNGRTDYVQVGDPPALRMSTTMSLEAWIYPTANQDGIILNKENEYEIARFADGSIRWAFRNTNPGWNWFTTGIVAPLNTWSRINLTYDNGAVQVYLNGIPVGSAYAGSGAIAYQGNDLWLGGRSCCAQFFAGNIAEVKLWNTVHPPTTTSGGNGPGNLTFVTRKTFDTSSRVLSVTTPDEGRTEYVYARDGRIRFSQSELQRPAGRFSYSNYDRVGRVVESGEYTPAAVPAPAPLSEQITGLATAGSGSFQSPQYPAWQAATSGQVQAGCCVGYLDYLGSFVEFTVQAPRAGTYALTLRYAAGRPGPDPARPERTMTLSVNGAVGNQVLFPITDNLCWCTYADKVVQVTLVAGTNVVRLENRLNDTGAINPAYLQFSEVSTAAATALIEERVTNANPAGSLDVARCAQRSQVWYDLPQTDPELGNRKQDFVLGAVAKTSKGANTTWYSYNDLGQLTWLVQKAPVTGVKAVDYTYDAAGNVTRVAYQTGQPDAFNHYYTYDANQRLTVVSTSPTDAAAADRTVQARYFYYLHGPLKRVETAGTLQGTDYAYTVQGWLKSINGANRHLDGDSPTNNGMGKDLFGLTLDYFSGDYRSARPGLATPTIPGAPATRYDGLVRSAAWFTAANPDMRQQVFGYDAKGQLLQADFGKLVAGATPLAVGTFVPAAANAYEEGGLKYDFNGNIETLRRRDGAGQITDNFAYQYPTGSNKLQAVNNPAGTAVLDYDYDAVGQMTRQRDEKGQRYLTYDVTGKVTGVYRDVAHSQPLVVFAYDDRGFRASKASYDPTTFALTKTTYSVRDAAGNELSSYVVDAAQPAAGVQRTEVPLYGASRLGALVRLPDGTDDYRYELNDQLGNARLIYHKPSTTSYAATLESGAASQEEKDFANLPATRFTAPGHGGSATVARLGITNGQSVGPAKTLTVQRGDTVTFTAYAWLTAALINRQAGGIANAVRVVPLVSLTAPTRANAARLTEGGAPAGVPAAPLPQVQVGVGLLPTGRGAATANVLTAIPGNAQLHYIVRDEQGTVVLDDYQSADPGQPLSWQQLQVGLRLQQAGTVELRVETVDALNPDVYVDDVRLDHTQSTIVQEQHNYAYGAPMLGLNYVVGSTRYRHGYQGQYAEINAETGTDDFELRNYDSRIGRWTAPDPEGQYDSPYVGMGNNPVSGVDPDGGFALPSLWQHFKAAIGIGHMIGGSVNLAYVAGNSALWQSLGSAARAVGQATVSGGLSAAVGAGGTALRAGQGPGQGPGKPQAPSNLERHPEVLLEKGLRKLGVGLPSGNCGCKSEGAGPPDGARIALGYGFDLPLFSIYVKALPYYSGWMSASASPALNMQILRTMAITQPHTTFHFNLTGRNGVKMNNPAYLNTWASDRTVMEYNLMQTALFRGRVTYYIKSGSIYKPVK